MNNANALKQLGLIRHNNFLGKKIGNKIWAHYRYINEIVPQEIVENGIKHPLLDFTPSVFRYDIKDKSIAFIECNNFDIEREPIIGDILTIKQDNTASKTKKHHDPFIYHHKWLFVKDDYAKFNVNESKLWSIEWRTKLGKNRELSSKIGRLSFWRKWCENLKYTTNAFIEQEFSSKNTSINKNNLPIIFNLINNAGGWKENTINLDLGGGKYDNSSIFLKLFNVKNMIYDIYNRTEDHNEAVLKEASLNGVDTVTLSNVLNVIKEDKIKTNLIQQAFNLLKPEGKLYITVYEGDRSNIGKQTGNDQWQENKKITCYFDLISPIFKKIQRKGKLITCKK